MMLHVETKLTKKKLHMMFSIVRTLVLLPWNRYLGTECEANVWGIVFRLNGRMIVESMLQVSTFIEETNELVVHSLLARAC